MVEKLVDAYWAKVGRAYAVQRVSEVLNDPRVQAMPKGDKVALRSKLENRVDFDILDIVVDAL